MAKLGICGICPNASKRTVLPERSDLTRRDFSCTVPTAKLAGDITYLKTTAGFIYLAVAHHLCTRMVVGLKHTGQYEGRSCRLCLEDGIFARIRGWRGHILSDRGSQYISSEFAACKVHTT
ncbi:MAG: DDE-type integrase/transposase/recombinase [Coriobacteriaceae bacterium]